MKRDKLEKAWRKANNKYEVALAKQKSQLPPPIP